MNVSRRALSERTNTSCVVLFSVPSGSGLRGFMSDKAVDSLPSAFDHTSPPPTPWSGGPTFFIVVAPSRRCGLDCVLYHRARAFSVGYDLGFPPLLRAGPCERWAQSRCFGRVLNERRTNAGAGGYYVRTSYYKRCTSRLRRPGKSAGQVPNLGSSGSITGVPKFLK